MNSVSHYIDIVFCLIVLPVMAMMFPTERWFHNFQWYVTLVGIWLYALYFLNRAITVPFMFHAGARRYIAISLILVSLILTYVLSQVDLYIPKPNVHDQGITRVFPSVLQYQQAVWCLFMIVMAFSFAVGLLTQISYHRACRREIEAERNRAEIQLYKAQIKPHFMFNTLNSLYGLFLTRDDKALTSLEEFISMMRYIYMTSRCDYVALKEEVDYIRQYVALQKLRLNEMTSVVLEYDIADGNFKVPPMLLITFVENCFKHGVSPVTKSDIVISICEKSRVLKLRTVNRVFHAVDQSCEHIGINNCRRRLELLFPGCHNLSIKNDGEVYEVNLKIEL